jgi:hypothetical protein
MLSVSVSSGWHATTQCQIVSACEDPCGAKGACSASQSINGLARLAGVVEWLGDD